MADRAVDDGELEVPREVFELDKDDRWQARLEEARARREIALREKAAGGVAPKKRLKPWEIEGVAAKPIEPIIQEREDDRLDFADRVDTIREVSKKEASEEKQERKIHKSHNWARVVEDEPAAVNLEEREVPEAEPQAAVNVPEAKKPPSFDDFDDILTRLPMPKQDRKDLSLVLPNAPDVSELASRYASSLVPKNPPEPEPEQIEAVAVATEPEKALANRRREFPMLLSLSMIALALVPFISKAPPLEKGPSTPAISVFRYQPALGVTWSLQETPVPTKSGEWVPRVTVAPVGPITPTDWQPATYGLATQTLVAPPIEAPQGALSWSGVAPVKLAYGARLFDPTVMPQATALFLADSPTRGTGDSDAQLFETTEPTLPVFGNVPAKPRPRNIEANKPDNVPDEASLSAPTKKQPLSQLKVTILVPRSRDQGTAASIATDLQDQGHRDVRLKEVDYSISSRNLRFFFDGDKAEAARLAKLYDAELRDFTWYRPRPASGTAELWLSGKSTNSNPVRSARMAVREELEPPAPQLVLPVPSVEIEPQEQSFLGRLFGGHTPGAGVEISDDGDNERQHNLATGDSATDASNGSDQSSNSDDTDTGSSSGNSGNGNGNGGGNAGSAGDT